jgi:hypothetical protein
LDADPGSLFDADRHFGILFVAPRQSALAKPPVSDNHAQTRLLLLILIDAPFSSRLSRHAGLRLAGRQLREIRPESHPQTNPVRPQRQGVSRLLNESRYIKTFVAGYGNDPRIAYLEIPIGGIESSPESEASLDTNCVPKMNSIGITAERWLAHALDTADLVGSLRPETQILWDLNDQGRNFT